MSPGRRHSPFSRKDREEAVDEQDHERDIDQKYRDYDGVAYVSAGSGDKLVHEHGALQGRYPDDRIVVNSHEDKRIPAKEPKDRKGIFFFYNRHKQPAEKNDEQRT